MSIAVEFNTPGYELDRGRDGRDIVSKREMYERFNTPHLIQDPDIPDEGEHLWEWFWHLSSRRMQGMDGPLALTYPEVDAWSRLTGEVVLREELLIITSMDDAYLSALAKEREVQRAANEKK